MEGRQSLDVVQISTEEANFMALDIDAATRSIQIRWLRPVNCDECIRGVKVASQVAEALREMRQQNYTLVQE